MVGTPVGNSLKQIVLALHNYRDPLRTFPSGVVNFPAMAMADAILSDLVGKPTPAAYPVLSHARSSNSPCTLPLPP